MIATAKDLIGKGIYSTTEAALYARVRRDTLRRWLFGGSSQKPVISRQVESPADNKVVTFLDFVQAMAIRAIRVQHDVPLQTIRKAHDRAVRDYGLEYPLPDRTQRS
ncbi:MAG: hypothetical protein R3C10_04020 [Pirellulales bacterium]